jgi:hypothetical protein
MRLTNFRSYNVGYQNKPQVQNQILKQPNRRSTWEVMDSLTEQSEIGGEGFKETAKEYLEKASNLYTGKYGTALRNMIPDSDGNARSSFPGEKHAILKLQNGKLGTANYMGPGTQVEKRLARGDPGRTESDMVAKRHDIDYTLASGSRNKEDQLNLVRKADKRMVASLNKVKDNSMNIAMGKRLIQAKMLGEDLGVMSKSKFAGELTQINDRDRILLMSEQEKMEQKGYGNRPGEELKMKIMKSLARKLGKNKKQKGGFFFAGIAALIAWISAASATAMATTVAGTTVGALVGSAATGAAGAIGAAIVGKIAGKGKGKGKAIVDKVKTKIKKAILDVKIVPKDLPKSVQEVAKKGLAILKKNPDKIKDVVRTLIPHVKKAIGEKVNKKMGGSGLGLAGGSKKVDSKIMKELKL